MPLIPGHPLISKDPEVCGGHAVITGTRMRTASLHAMAGHAIARSKRLGRVVPDRDTIVRAITAMWPIDPYTAAQINAALDYEEATGEADRGLNADYLKGVIVDRLEAADSDEIEAIWAAVQAVPKPERPR